ncbi:UvrD-helicase domain-containing protein [Shimia sp. MIT1388]|uniref:UvrD-helicase domain-containing protein n=1 Tax=Shimia sp. MIT1388 TaxID=3096992 RepID=UPI00399A0840
MTHLTLVPAGAGAGKTYRIKETLANWIEAGTVAPGRILAVTFTEAAASELRGRVRAELMARGRIDDALEIDRAYVGTIHALGQRLLTEHAFAAGRAPDSRLLSDAERDLMIRLEMAKCAALEPMMTDLGRFGYSYRNGVSAEEAFRAKLLNAIDLLRGLGARGQSPEILEMALQDLESGYGDCAKDGLALTDTLRSAVRALLQDFPTSLASQFDGNKTAASAFRDNHSLLRRALRPGVLETDWGVWQKLRDLRLSKRGAQTPEGYDDLAQRVIDAADALPRHPGPLNDAKAHLSAIVKGAQDVQSAYQTAKARAGVMDYADMIAETEALLRTQGDILTAVLGEIDCVVIDEFQDTNPVQFSLLWQLARGAKQALIVGDTKQSIMGFQGADARLSSALSEGFPDAVDPLDRNWRSDPRIMSLVNTLGPCLFPNGYDALKPQLSETGKTALEAINLPARVGLAPACIANRVADLLEDGEQVRDKESGTLRPARPSDVAILCYTHSKCMDMAKALEARGLPVRIQQSGWYDGLPIQLARAALAFVADPSDQLAALTWLTLGPPRIAIEDAMRRAVDGVLLAHDALKPLRDVHSAYANCSVAEITSQTLKATGLREWTAGLPEARQALADLTRLQAEAQDFDAQDPELRAAAGFHGTGVQVFLGWLGTQTDPKADRHPDPDGWSSAGIEISTWHAAKGREWPITVVAGLDKTIAESPGTLRAEFARFDDLNAVLDHAGLGFLPDFKATETQSAFAEARRDADEQEAARKLYVALTRARDRLILALPPEPKKERTEATRMVHLLRDRANLQTVPGALSVAGTDFAARVVEGNPEAPASRGTTTSKSQSRFGVPAPMLDVSRTPWRQQPSSMIDETPTRLAPLQTVEIAPPVATKQTEDATKRGTAWHLAFRVFASRPDLTDRLAEASGLPQDTLMQLRTNTQSVVHWLAQNGYHKLHFELPLQLTNADGSQTNAIVDCLAEGTDGLLILDHKSGACPDPNSRFETYLPQLKAYQALVEGAFPDKPVSRLAINWMSEGTVSFCPATQKETV